MEATSKSIKLMYNNTSIKMLITLNEKYVDKDNSAKQVMHTGELFCFYKTSPWL